MTGTVFALLVVVVVGPVVVIGRHLWSQRRLDRAALVRIDEIL